MSDVGRGLGEHADEDRLPWLEPVEDEAAEEGVSAFRLIAGLVVALVALGLVVGGVYWLKQRSDGAVAGGDPTLIAAQPGPYKVKPADAGGMQVKGQGDSAFAASEGADPAAKIDLTKLPEAPIARPSAKAPSAQPAPVSAPKPEQPAAKPAPVARVAVPEKAAPAPKPVPVKPAPKPEKVEKTETATAPAASAPAAGGTIQLGALDSQAKAEAAWKSLSGRYGYLASLSHMVVKAEVNGKTYYRLRAAAGGQASSICQKLKVAGEACAVVG